MYYNTFYESINMTVCVCVCASVKNPWPKAISFNPF